jgi:molecular chaperone DnaK (HSP70)
LSEEDRETIRDTLKETESWMEANPEAETEEYNTKKSEVEDVVKPIIAKLYSNGASPDQEEDLGQHDEL